MKLDTYKLWLKEEMDIPIEDINNYDYYCEHEDTIYYRSNNLRRAFRLLMDDIYDSKVGVVIRGFLRRVGNIL
jgi:hypothetical protein